MSHAETFLPSNHNSQTHSMYGAKRWLWLMGFIPPALPVFGYLLVQATGWPLFYWFGPIFILSVVLIDFIVGVDKSSYAVSEIAAVENESYYRWVANLVMPIQYGSLIWSAWMLVHGGLNAFDTLGLAATLGIANGICITNAHEIGHKPEKLERWLAKFVLAPTFFGHFTTEHNGGHHVWAATPEDFSSARMGESFYVYFPRTLIGGIREAWTLEKQRLARRGMSHWSWRNDALSAWIVTPVLFAGLATWLGWSVLPWLILQGFIGLTMLEMVNYVQHYGLLRAKRRDGRYQPCEPRHSWNSSHLATNIMLYHLPRHSDHHAHPMRHYQALRHFEEAPQLPTGYAGMSLATLIPPLWSRIVDPVLVAHAEGDLDRINVHPPAKARLARRWAAARSAP
ncbi:MAG TPA: alkane 1-monooxygenase [Rhodoblastus sp.]|nr:alkane 1-monooxygenase [Rhodoblastus sp.]